jgi:hypothetical protein
MSQRGRACPTSSGSARNRPRIDRTLKTEVNILGQKNHGDKRDSEIGTGTHPRKRTKSPARAPGHKPGEVRGDRKTPRGKTTRPADK